MAFTTTAVVMLVFLILFHSLSVEIENGVLTCYFGCGLIRRKIPLSKIDGLKSVKNPWIAGWGIRWMPGKCLLWNVSGFDAVELTFESGKRFRIGTDEPEALISAILANKK